MKYKNIRQGFTLIELLVVVLIIGILAAVALPQYQRAVQKAQFAKLRVLADSIGKTVQSYYLGNGNWPQSFDELDVSLPAELSTITTRSAEHTVCANNDKMYCCIMHPRKYYNGGNILCGTADYSLAYTHRFATVDGTPQTQYACSELTTDSFCKTLPGATRNTATAIMTPESWRNGNSKMVSYDIN